MATSTCLKCGNHSFEMVLNTPIGSEFKLWFVQCSQCGCVIGTHEFYSIVSVIKNLADKLNIELTFNT